MLNNLIIAIGSSRTTKQWNNTKITWDKLLERLKTTTRTPETQGQFINMTKQQQDNIKDIGGFVGGKLKNGIRKKDYIEKRYIITLDADFADADFCDSIEMLFDFTYCIYSTHKHTPEKPRLRLIIPLSRPCNPDEYEAISRLIASDIGINMFDDTTYEAHRLMYWPSTSLDGEYVFKFAQNKFLDVDKVLNRYEDWTNINEWPVSSRTIRKKEASLKKQEDPTLKNGIVGAFCRTYDIDTAIETFIPDVYSKCSNTDRYTYNNGSSAAGLVIYENSKFAYSNHSTDPAGGLLCNAFDLIRIHKFIDLDENAADGTPVVKRPSYLAMQELASKDENVKFLIHKEKSEAAKDDFKDIEIDEDEASKKWLNKLAVNKRGNYVSSIDNVRKVLNNDNLLKNKFALNEFTRKFIVYGKLPWNTDKKERTWTDADDAGLRHYMEVMYDIKGKNYIDDAWVLIADKNKYHPVKEYLSSLKWDNTKRLETVFIDYLGADDNKYVRAATRKSLVAAVARIFNPGVKYDNVVVLVGTQGQGKSQILKLLGKEWYSDTFTTMQGKEAFEQIQGVWIVEIGELSAMKRSDVESIKHFISKSEDIYRAAYGHHTDANKRQCVFFGTTNNAEFLKDNTGNRRFWPIDVDTKKAKKDLWKEFDNYTIDQIWAEAVQAYKNKETIYFDDEEVKKISEIEQNKHLEESPLSGDVREYLERLLPEEWESLSLSDRRMFIQHPAEQQYKGTIKREKVCIMEIWCEMFNGEKKDLTMQKSKEIKDIILKTGQWEQTKSTISFGKLYGYQRGFKKI